MTVYEEDDAMPFREGDDDVDAVVGIDCRGSRRAAADEPSPDPPRPRELGEETAMLGAILGSGIKESEELSVASVYQEAQCCC